MYVRTKKHLGISRLYNEEQAGQTRREGLNRAVGLAGVRSGLLTKLADLVLLGVAGIGFTFQYMAAPRTWTLRRHTVPKRFTFLPAGFFTNICVTQWHILSRDSSQFSGDNFPYKNCAAGRKQSAVGGKQQGRSASGLMGGYCWSIGSAYRFLSRGSHAV